MVALYCDLRRGSRCEAPRALTAWKGHLWSLLLQSACFRGRRVFALCMVAVIFITCCCQAPLSFLHRQHKLLRSDCVLAFPPLPLSICSILSLSFMPYGNGVGSSINCSCRSLLGCGWGWVGVAEGGVTPKVQLLVVTRQGSGCGAPCIISHVK